MKKIKKWFEDNKDEIAIFSTVAVCTATGVIVGFIVGALSERVSLQRIIIESQSSYIKKIES